jgi:hypothetical protein
MRVVTALFFIVVLMPVAFAQTPQTKVPLSPQGEQRVLADEVRGYCQQLDDYKKEETPQLFADATDEPKPAWKRIGTERELEGLTEALFKRMNTGRVWLKDGKVVAAELESATGTADWLLHSEYCFRADGKLAGIHSEYRNDVNDFSIYRDQFFDTAGTVIDSTNQNVDLRTRKPKRLTKQMEAAEVKAPVYHTPKELPFYKLIRFK